MKIGLNTQQEQKNSKKSGKRKNKRSAKLEKMQVFEKVAKDIKDIKETEITEGIDPVLLSDNTLFDDTLDLMGNTSGDLIKDMAPTEGTASTTEGFTENTEEAGVKSNSIDTLIDSEEFCIDTSLIFSEDFLVDTEELLDDSIDDMVDDLVTVDDISTGAELETSKEDTSLKETVMASSDDTTSKIKDTAPKMQGSLKKDTQDVAPYKVVGDVSANYMTDYEFEVLMDIFSTLTKKEVDALPENYKKLFYQNFEENEAYLDEETNKLIRNKLGIRTPSGKLGLRPMIDSSVEEYINQEIHIDKLTLPAKLLDKTLSKKHQGFLGSKSMESIWQKLNKSPKLQDNTAEVQVPIGEPVEDTSMVVYYKNDEVPEAELLQEGLIGIKAYKVFEKDTLKKCNRNFEIEIKAGSRIKIDTGIFYVTDASCSANVIAGKDLEDLILEKSYEEDKSLILEYIALADTYISKSTVIGCIQIN